VENELLWTSTVDKQSRDYKMAKLSFIKLMRNPDVTLELVEKAYDDIVKAIPFLKSFEAKDIHEVLMTENHKVTDANLMETYRALMQDFYAVHLLD